MENTDADCNEADDLAEQTEDCESKNIRKWRKLFSFQYWLGFFFIQLTADEGKTKLSKRRSGLIEILLYASHWCSAWGDRMWGFALSLLLVDIYPESLLLPAVYGFVTQLVIVIFGTLVGDLVDFFPRLKVVFLSLLVQNSLVALCATVLALAFYFGVSACAGGTLHDLYFGLTVVAVIILGSTANLATLLNTISVERDWIVVISDKNKNSLAVLNANMRRIDLCCKLLAPALCGVVLSLAGPLWCTVFVAAWNVFSFFLEFSLIWLVYKLVPTLKHKTYRKLQYGQKSDSDGGDDDDILNILDDDDDDDDQMEPLNYDSDKASDEQQNPKEENDSVDTETRPSSTSKGGVILKKVLAPYYLLKDGWSIYWRHSVAIVGCAIATLYLTVLGFNGVTSGYFKTQRLSEALIGLSQGIGAIIGMLGTFFYQPLRQRVGTARAGLVGISLQLIMIIAFCGTSVFIPGYPIPNRHRDYFAPYCENVNPLQSSDMQQTSIVPTATRSAPITATSNNEHTILPTGSLYSMQSPFTSLSITSSSSINMLPSMTPSATPNDSITPSSEPQLGTTHIALMLVGVLGARFGLWMFDLAVSQLIQENVPEQERGVFSGVMNMFISIMDLLQFTLVIFVPRPEHFPYLAGVSVAMVGLGYLQYAIYIRKTRGHFFHFQQLFTKCKENNCCQNRGSYASHLIATEDPDL